MRASEFLGEFRRAAESALIDQPAEALWPEAYQRYDGDVAFAFLTQHCYTMDETVMPARVSPIPEKDYIRLWCHQAVECRKRGVTQCLIKSRRMVMSWVATAFDLWEAGLYGSGQYIVASRNMDMSAELLWRTVFMYNQIAIRNPGWGLAKLREKVDLIRWKGAKSYQQVTLPNGSVYVALSGEAPDNMRQYPARRIRLEEIGTWTYPGYAYSTAQHMVQGRPGEIGGNITIISTAYPGWLKEQRTPMSEKRVIGSIVIPASELVGKTYIEEQTEGLGIPEAVLNGAAIISAPKVNRETERETPTRIIYT
jgi:hypothetical protein